ncbi:hypothetical protein Taro_007971 [Colocasia esculenta]|uniref:Retrotransposon gag domain-containing protein n=1 Tax=Colocasia esculenta TaxID=4460 RepID=A0A843U5L9_COLES|nr:hypothetical protein [Colocasia esculenta]
MRWDLPTSAKNMQPNHGTASPSLHVASSRTRHTPPSRPERDILGRRLPKVDVSKSPFARHAACMQTRTAFHPVLLVVTDPLVVTLSHQRSRSRHAFGRGTPSRRVLVATRVGVTFLSRRLKVVDAYRGYLSSWVPQAVVMADRRDWGGGGDDPEESTQRMIERIWESLTDIRMRMDQQALVPPVIGEAVPVALVPPPPGVEVPFVAPVPPSPPVIAAEEPVVQVERFLRLQPPTYTGGPNPDTTEHWIHEIERVFMTMRCPAVDRVLLATYQLRGFAQEWWRLKTQTTFAGRIEGAITWPEFLEVFNDTFFPLQVQQAKRE